MSESSYGNILEALRVMLHNKKLKVWPKHDEASAWQNLIITHFETVLHMTDVTYETRITYWECISRFYKELKQIGVIPTRVTLPSTRLSNTTLKNESKIPPFKFQSKAIASATTIGEILPKKFLIERDLSQADDVYLSNFKSGLEKTCNEISTALTNYWDEMLEAHTIGRDIIAKIPVVELEDSIASRNYCNAGKHVCDIHNPLAFNWFLAVCKHHIDTGLIKEINGNQIRKTDFGRSLKSKRIRALYKQAKEICPQNYIKASSANEYLNRLMGYLSIVDCHAASAILVMNNPVFTPEGISLADLYMKNNDSYLLVDTELDRVRFSISKPRAQSRKHSYLNQTSRRIIATVIEATGKLREQLKLSGRPDWRRLFIYISAKSINTSPNNKSLSNPKNSLLERISRDIDVQSGKLKFSLGTIRASQGILAFLRSGSLALTSMILGNTPAVVETNYIPAWLVKRFANRTLRILQQKILVVANEGTPWMLDASDFESESDLHEFIYKILNEAAGIDPFSRIAKKRLSKYQKDATQGETYQRPTQPGDLNLGVSSHTLAALYAYEQKALTLSPNKQYIINPVTGLSPRSLASVAELFRRAAEIDIDSATEVDFRIASRFVGDSFYELKEAHKEAISLMPKYLSCFVEIGTKSGKL
ncbi:hypothetical protein [Pseudomonas reinekei]|uniref:Integrase n=1 Tax=Pseudomonas reinekei TaxID=395598 RepID=A0A6H9RAA2_PSERE|nr:hypothetical protein [Pseudomonas reinekei]KAB0483808.1 hypothetical protein F7R15_19330 [Pseudomonas reinekei]